MMTGFNTRFLLSPPVLFLLIPGLFGLYNEEGPSFIEEPPSNVEFLNERGVELNCTASGRPSPSILWSSGDGTSLFDIPGLRHTSKYGALILSPFLAESFRPDVHSATVRCVATNSFGTIVSRDVRLRAVVKQAFEPEVHNVRAIKDFPVILQCGLPNFLRDFVTVTSWIHGSFNILPYTSGSGLGSSSSSSSSFSSGSGFSSSGLESLPGSGKYYMLDDGQLLIWQVTSEDSHSSYQCRTYHRLTGQTSVSPPAKIIVSEMSEPSRPVIEQKVSNSLIVKENERVVMPCVAYGYPKITTKWYKRDGNRLTPVINDSVGETWINSRLTVDSAGISVRHGALIINSVKVSNKGSYLCNVSNSQGSDSLEIHVTVRSSLTVNLQPEKVTVDLGKNAEFNCYVSGKPSVQIHWMKDGRMLRAGNTAGRIRFIGQTRIQVMAVQREDTGIYQCLARNDFETSQRAAQLWLGDSPPKFTYRFIEQSLQPGPAISLKCSATGNPTPHISWLLDGFELPTAASDRFLMGQYANVYGDVISHVNITSVRIQDGGQYECIASNRAGKEVHSAALNIYGAPYVRNVADITAVAGKKLKIKCPVGGYPIESITFEKDGVKLPWSRREEVKDGTLFLENVERSDEGTYSCHAKNKQGQSSQTSVKVKVIVPPKITPFSFPSWVKVNERAGVQCLISLGDPPFHINWVKDNTIPLNNNNTNSNSNPNANTFTTRVTSVGGQNINKLHNKYNDKDKDRGKIIIGHSEFSSYLNIPATSVEHMGNYTCTVTSSLSGQTASYTAQLRVNAGIKISKFSFEEGLISDRGMRAQVICAAVEGQPTNITWFRNGEKIQTTDPENIPMQTVDDVQKKEAEVSIKRFDAFSSILTILNVSWVHSGDYKCVLANDFEQTSHETTLVVRVPPKFVVEPQDQQITVGTQVVIDCVAEGNPKPRIFWKQVVGPVEKKDFRDVGYRTLGVLQAENGSLIINTVTEDHNGYYSCVASQPGPTSTSSSGQRTGEISTSDSHTEISKLIQLIVNAPPRIKARPPKEIRRRGETAILKCEATGDEPIHFSWFSKGIDISLINEPDPNPRYSVSSEDVQTSKLTIREVSPGDRGDFECIASNNFGQDQIRITLLVQERPGVPQNLHVIEKSSRSVMLSWSTADNSNEPDSPVLNYILSYKEESGRWEEETTREKTTAGDLNSITVKNLQPSTVYEFRLTARNSQGNSEPSSILKIRTDSEPPTGPPLDISLEALTSTKIKVTWKPPRREDRNGEVLGYNIRYRSSRNELGHFNWSKMERTGPDSSSSSPSSSSFAGTLTMSTSASTSSSSSTSSGSGTVTKSISGLEKYEEYHVSIQAFNDKGVGPFSEPAQVHTLEDVPSAPPDKIQCSPLTPHSLQINWEPPAIKFLHGNLEGFRIVAETPPEFNSDQNLTPISSEIKVSAPSTSAVMHNFRPFTNYSIQVAAATRIGEGVLSSPLICQTKESVPSEPSGIKTVFSSSDSVIVSWLPPRVPNGNIVKFNVYVRISASAQGREIRTVKRNLAAHVLHYQVTDLKRREFYEAWVTAETSVGEGQSTISVPFSTPPPLNIPAAIISFGTVILAPLKSRVILKCDYVGTSVTVQWLKGGMKIRDSSSSRFDILPNKSLSIDSVEKVDSSNISCHVKNSFGSDTISYVLKVQVAPTAPLLHVTSYSSDSVKLQWKQGDNGGAPVLGFTLIYRRQEGGEWEELNLSRKLVNYQVMNLSCGTSYEFFLTAFNKIGSGEPSARVLVRTKGSRPVIPPLRDFFQSDPTSIQLNFSDWSNSEQTNGNGHGNSSTQDCPVQSYTVEYKPKGSNWILIPEGKNKNIIEINGLTPETEYKLRIQAQNEAGSSSAEYSVSTSLEKGGLLSSSNLSHEQVPFYQDFHIILPVLVSLTSILIAVAGVLLCWKKKNNYRASGILESRAHPLAHQEDKDYAVIRAKYISDCDRLQDDNIYTDINPYATFQLPPQQKVNYQGTLLYGPGPTRIKSGDTTTTPIRIPTIHRVASIGGTKKRIKSQRLETDKSGRTGASGGGGESDEYDSLGSDGESDGNPAYPIILDHNNPVMNILDGMGGIRRVSVSSRANPAQFLCDETLIVSDRGRNQKSLSRSSRSKGGVEGKYLDETSFIAYGPSNPNDWLSTGVNSGEFELMDGSGAAMTCDVEVNRPNLRRKSDHMIGLLGGASNNPGVEKGKLSKKNPAQTQAQNPDQLLNLRHPTDYTIAV